MKMTKADNTVVPEHLWDSVILAFLSYKLCPSCKACICLGLTRLRECILFIWKYNVSSKFYQWFDSKSFSPKLRKLVRSECESSIHYAQAATW